MSVVNIVFSATVILAMVLLMHLFVRVQMAPQAKAAPAAAAAVSENMVNELMATLDAFDNGMAREMPAAMVEQEQEQDNYTFAPLAIRF